MRFQLMLLPVAAVAMAAATPAAAENFMTVEQAQQAIFPGAKFAPADFDLSPAEMDRLGEVSKTTVFRSKVRVWKVSNGGWFYLDQVPGRDDRITYAIGINPDGSVKSIEILVCVAEYGQVRQPQWRRHFVGKKYTPAHLVKQIPNISGTTLSVVHIADGVTRVLATHALYTSKRK